MTLFSLYFRHRRTGTIHRGKFAAPWNPGDKAAAKLKCGEHVIQTDRITAQGETIWRAHWSSSIGGALYVYLTADDGVPEGRHCRRCAQ